MGSSPVPRDWRVAILVYTFLEHHLPRGGSETGILIGYVSLSYGKMVIPDFIVIIILLAPFHL